MLNFSLNVETIENKCIFVPININNMETLTKQEYAEALKRHDWGYEYSDDHQVYLRGSEENTRLYEIAKQDPEFMDMYFDARKLRLKF